MSTPAPILQYTLNNKDLLPAGYTPLAYIESTGTLYINTGYSTTDGYYGECTVSYSDYNTEWGVVVGAESGTDLRNHSPYINKSGLKWGYGAGTHTLSSVTVELNKKYDLYWSTIKTENVYAYINGVKVWNYSNTNARTSNAIYVFASLSGSSATNYVKAKVYNLSIRDKNGTLILHYRPCIQDSNGAIGMYDLVSRSFKANSGSGTFIAGPPLAVGKGGGKSLPEEYLLVEYLESTKNEYINTGLYPSSNTKVDIYFELFQLNDNWSPIVASYESGKFFSLWFKPSQNCTGYATETYNSYSFPINTKTRCYNNANEWYRDGTKFSTNTATTFSSGSSKTIWIFGYEDGRRSLGRIYQCKFYESSTLVRDFYPCYRKSDMKPGMYDTVNGVFYTNSGSGEFILGPSVCPYYSCEVNAQGGSFDYFKSLDVGGRTTLINGGKGFTATFTSNDTYNFMNMHPLIPGYKFTFSCDVSGLPSGGYWYFNLWNDENTHPWKLQNGHNKLTTLITTDRIKNYNTNNYTQLNRMLWDDGSRSTPDNSSTIRVENVKIYQGIYDTPKYAYFHNVSTTYDSRFGWVADFNGSAIEMPGLQTLLKGGENFTFSIWFKRNSGSGWLTIWGCSGFELEAARSGTFNVVAYNWGLSSSGGIAYTSGEWHHLVMTRNSSESKFYLDGVLSYTGSAHTIPNTPLYLGAWANPKSLNFTGQMANMMLFDTVLTAGLVKELYGQ